jgi:hypothetical protein
MAMSEAESRQEGRLNRKLVVMLKMVTFAPMPSAEGVTQVGQQVQ